MCKRRPRIPSALPLLLVREAAHQLAIKTLLRLQPAAADAKAEARALGRGQMMERGEKDVYHLSSTHWSYASARRVAAAVARRLHLAPTCK